MVNNNNILQDNIEQLIRIYNTLFEISTKGEDTLIMADCLRSFKNTITNIQNVQINKEE